MADQPHPDSRIAIVTGASRGIGAAAAKSLAAQGRHVVCAARNQEKLEQVRSEINQAGGSSEVLTVDIGEQNQITALIEQVVQEHGKLDILVNNAGITRDNLLMRMTDEEFDQVIQTNMRSVFIACRAALRPMIRGKWGRIVNLGSVAGLVGNAGQFNYAAAKAGVVGMTRTLAKEAGSKGITANVVAPGFIETDMTEVLPDKIKDQVKEMTPLRRLGKVNEAASAITYLCSDDAGYITGQTLAVDGGMTMA